MSFSSNKLEEFKDLISAHLHQDEESLESAMNYLVYCSKDSKPTLDYIVSLIDNFLASSLKREDKIKLIEDNSYLSFEEYSDKGDPVTWVEDLRSRLLEETK